MNRRMYELAILKELGERIGYSLNIQQIIDIITGSLRQFIEYSAVAYMLLEPEKIIFRVDLERSVNRKFIDEMRGKMIRSLSALLEKDFISTPIEEVLSGAILVEDVEEPVGSSFNIPLVIGGKVVGILTIAHTKFGLYKEEDMTILYKITRQASQAVTKLQEVVEIEQRKLNAMVESMEDGVLMTDKDFRILVANPAVRGIIGFTGQPDDLTIFDFIGNLGDKFDIRGRLEESVKHGKTAGPIELVIGESFFQIFVLPVKTSVGVNVGEILGGVVIFHDITKERQAEKMREDFISMMVHELRSPLNGIQKTAEAMSKWDKKKAEDQTNKYSQMIFDCSSNILELVNDLLDAARLEAGRFELRKTPANIGQIIADRVKFFEASAQSSQLNLSLVLGQNLPAEAVFDPTHIAQVLNNLISNALKFTNPGGTITVKAVKHQQGKNLTMEGKETGVDIKLGEAAKKLQNVPNAVVVTVTDTGVGISTEDQKQLFNKFKQLGNHALVIDEKRGTGLGLVIAKGIVEEHGGIIGVESEEGTGSTFYFTVPIS